MDLKKIAITSDATDKAVNLKLRLVEKYSFTDIDHVNSEDVKMIIVLGGDGYMLHCLHSYHDLGIPFYGINCGSIGFLLNHYTETDELLEKLDSVVASKIFPLLMRVTTDDSVIHEVIAFNEVSLLRQKSQAAHLQIDVDNELYLKEMICDGMLVATPAGSSAYNHSAGGRIIPLDSNIISLTPLSPFRPRSWPGALLKNDAKVSVYVGNPEKRPVSATADFREFRNIISVEVKMDTQRQVTLLFDQNHSLEERILREQFAY